MKMNLDLCVTAAYGNFLPQKFLDIPRFGTLNIHPSLLPQFRGAAPVQRCIESGLEETGVTVAFTVLKMDAGPILTQTKYTMNGSEKAHEMLDILFDIKSFGNSLTICSLKRAQALLGAMGQDHEPGPGPNQAKPNPKPGQGILICQPDSDH